MQSNEGLEISTEVSRVVGCHKYTDVTGTLILVWQKRKGVNPENFC